MTYCPGEGFDRRFGPSRKVTCPRAQECAKHDPTGRLLPMMPNIPEGADRGEACLQFTPSGGGTTDNE